VDQDDSLRDAENRAHYGFIGVMQLARSRRSKVAMLTSGSNAPLWQGIERAVRIAAFASA
jgi:hypothetical protein